MTFLQRTHGHTAVFELIPKACFLTPSHLPSLPWSLPVLSCHCSGFGILSRKSVTYSVYTETFMCGNNPLKFTTMSHLVKSYTVICHHMVAQVVTLKVKFHSNYQEASGDAISKGKQLEQPSLSNSTTDEWCLSALCVFHFNYSQELSEIFM